jgi:hypothetical protein
MQRYRVERIKQMLAEISDILEREATGDEPPEPQIKPSDHLFSKSMVHGLNAFKKARAQHPHMRPIDLAIEAMGAALSHAGVGDWIED